MIKKYILAAIAVMSFSVPVYSQVDSNPPDSKETKCIALAIQKEAGNQPLRGMKAIGHVVINRMNSGKYPSTACGVVYQKNGKSCQFSWVCSKHTSTKISEMALSAAETSLSELDFTENSISFHIKKVHPHWTNMKQTMIIGAHIFYASRTTDYKFRQAGSDLS